MSNAHWVLVLQWWCCIVALGLLLSFCCEAFHFTRRQLWNEEKVIPSLYRSTLKVMWYVVLAWAAYINGRLVYLLMDALLPPL